MPCVTEHTHTKVAASSSTPARTQQWSGKTPVRAAAATAGPNQSNRERRAAAGDLTEEVFSRLCVQPPLKRHNLTLASLAPGNWGDTSPVRLSVSLPFFVRLPTLLASSHAARALGSHWVLAGRRRRRRGSRYRATLSRVWDPSAATGHRRR